MSIAMPRAILTRTFLSSLAATCLLLTVVAPTGQALTISDGVGSITVDDGTGGLTDFTVNGANDFFELRYFYRTSAMSQEARIVGGVAGPAVSSVSQTAADTIRVLGSVSEFDFQLDYVLAGASLNLSLTVTETNGSPLTLSLFSYQDWDMAGPGGGDLLIWDGTVMTASDLSVSRTVDVTTTTAPDATEAAAWPALVSAFEDAGITNLTDGAGLPFGPGDATFAFQYDRVITANGFTTIDMDFAVVPEPGTASLTGLGLLILGLARRRASSLQ